MTQSSVNLPLTGSGDTTAKAAVKKLSTNEVVQQVELVTAVDGGALTPIASGNPLEVAIVGTVPISGAPTTVTANLGTLNGAGLDTSLQSILTKLNASVGVTGTFWQATQPVSGTFWQATQPVSAASLPLPTGAATAAKQPALGTVGSPSADFLTVQGNASGTPIPVSGTFSASGTTDLTASGSITGTGAVATISTLNGMSTLEVDISGTWSATFGVQGTVDGTNWFFLQQGPKATTNQGVLVASATIAANANFIFPIAGLSGVRVNCTAYVSGTVVVSLRASAAVGPVVIAASLPTGANTIGAVNNLLNGVLAVAGNGVTGTGTQRVTIASDSTGVVGLNAGTNLVGKVGIDQTTPGTTNAVAVVNPTSTLAAAVQIAVTATAGTLLAAGTYKSIGFRNLSTSASSVFIGPATVSATTGMEIKPGEFYGYGPGECPSNLIQAICPAAGTATVIVQVAT